MDDETVELEARCNAIIQKSILKKSRDLDSFTIPVTIGRLSVGKTLLDLGASINLIPLSMIERIGEVKIKSTRMTLHLTDITIKHPYGIVEDIWVKVDQFLFLVDFVVMDMDEDSEFSIININHNFSNLHERHAKNQWNFTVFIHIHHHKVD